MLYLRSFLIAGNSQENIDPVEMTVLELFQHLRSNGWRHVSCPELDSCLN